MSEIDSLAAIAREELEAANRELIGAGISEGTVGISEWKPWQTMVASLSGEFKLLGGHELSIEVEIDPAKVGWRLSADVCDYGISPSQEANTLHTEGIRVMSDKAATEVRRLTRNAISALRRALGLSFDDQQQPDFLRPFSVSDKRK